MEKNKERRYIDRVVFPEAKVYYRRMSRYSLLKNYQGPVDLADISKSALSIHGKIPFEKKTALEVKLVIPGCPDITIKCWIRGFDERNANTVLQFLPFGIGGNYNSFRTKQNLEMLLNSDLLYFSHLTLA